jgi:SAM-dependent methyltransferase
MIRGRIGAMCRRLEHFRPASVWSGTRGLPVLKRNSGKPEPGNETPASAAPSAVIGRRSGGLYSLAVKGVSAERWEEAQNAERGFWSTGGFGLTAFRGAVGGSMETAEWARQQLTDAGGDWLEIGVGPLGVGCSHFLGCGGELHTLDPIQPTPDDEWQLPVPCKALIRACQEATTMHVGQGEHLEFPDDAFTLVALENMLDHVQDPGAVLREVRRVLAPGGLLVVAVDTFSTMGEAKYRLVTRRQQSSTIFVRAHPHRFSGKDVAQIVIDAGFDVTKADMPGRLTSLVGRCYRTRILAV